MDISLRTCECSLCVTSINFASAIVSGTVDQWLGSSCRLSPSTCSCHWGGRERARPRTLRNQPSVCGYGQLPVGSSRRVCRRFHCARKWNSTCVLLSSVPTYGCTGHNLPNTRPPSGHNARPVCKGAFVAMSLLPVLAHYSLAVDCRVKTAIRQPPSVHCYFLWYQHGRCSDRDCFVS